MPAKKRAPTLKPSQLRHVLNVTQATSRHPARDCLAVLATHSAGLRVTELARLEVRDVLWPSGRLRDEMLLRAEITKNCKSRMVFLTVPKLRQSLESYLDFRCKNQLGCSLDAKEYRGLLPESKLLLTHRGGGFELVRKRRTLPDGRTEDVRTLTRWKPASASCIVPLASDHQAMLDAGRSPARSLTKVYRWSKLEFCLVIKKST